MKPDDPGDPGTQLQKLTDLINQGWVIYDTAEQIRERYRSYEASEAVPRAILYLDLGVLHGIIDRERVAAGAALQASGELIGDLSVRLTVERARAEKWKRRAEYFQGAYRHWKLEAQNAGD